MDNGNWCFPFIFDCCFSWILTLLKIWSQESLKLIEVFSGLVLLFTLFWINIPQISSSSSCFSPRLQVKIRACIGVWAVMMPPCLSGSGKRSVGSICEYSFSIHLDDVTWQPTFWIRCWHFHLKSALGNSELLWSMKYEMGVSCGWQDWTKINKICGCWIINKVIVEIRN